MATLGRNPPSLACRASALSPILGKGIIHSISSISGPRPCFFPGPRPGFPSSILGYLTPTARKNQIKSLALQGFSPLAGGRGGIFPPPRLCPAKTAGRLFFCLLFPASPCYNIGEKQNMRQISGLRPPKSCAGAITTDTTAQGRTAWTILYSFSRPFARVSLCFARLKDCLLS